MNDILSGTPTRAKPQGEERWAKLPTWHGECLVYRARVPSVRIGYINAIMETYEGMARVRTEHIREGILRMVVPSDWEEPFLKLMETLRHEEGIDFPWNDTSQEK